MPTKAIVALQGWLPGTADDGRFARHVLTLACGTLAAQLVTVAAAPVLARLYAPEAFGVFGALIGLGTVLGAVVGLKYELAIILERSEADALNALRLVLAVAAALTLVLSCGTIIAGSALGRLLDIQGASPLLLAGPVFALLFGCSQALSFWATRHERWAVQAQSELARNVATAGGQLALGLLAAGPVGLMAGRIFGELGMLVRLWRGAGLHRGHGGAGSRLFVDADRARLQSLAIRHRELALYQTPRAFLHSALVHLPALLLVGLASPAIAGLYWFAARFLRMLVTLLANAVCRVFFKGAVAIRQAGYCTRPFLIRVTLLLGLAGMLPMLVLAAEGPTLFAFAFGDDWRAAGEYARWLAIWSWFDLMAAPAGMLVSVYMVQRPFFCADLLAAVIGATSLTLAAASGRFELAIGLYVAAMAGRNAYSIGFMLRAARGRDDDG
jgi:O-antigen/teichoic acid export membrane protein